MQIMSLPVLNKNFQLSGGFNKKLGNNNKLGAVFAINYNQSNKRTDYINNRLFGVQDDLPFITYDYSDKKYSQDILMGWTGQRHFTIGKQ